MRRALSVLLVAGIVISLAGCWGGKGYVAPSATPTPEKTRAQRAIESMLARYDGTEEGEEERALLDREVALTAEGLQAVEEYLDGVAVEYPFTDITRVDSAFEQYLALSALAEDGGGDGEALLNALPMSTDELLELVKANNEEFLAVPGIKNSMYRPLEEDYLEWVCEVVADTLNRELAEVDFGAQLGSIAWNVENLKILKGGSVANASYTKGSVMQVRKSGAESMVAITGEEMAAHMTVTHEVEHLLQNMSEPAQRALGLEQCYGFSYNWADMAVNSLYFTWFTEASAERLSAAFYDTQPTTYASMISYLDSLTLPTLLRGSQPLDTPRLSQQSTLEAVFEHFGCETEEERFELLNMLYGIELIQTTPEGFWEVYTAETGLEQNDDSIGALRREIKEPVCITMSRYFYRDLARCIAAGEMTLRELFYLISMWEFDLNTHIIYEDETRIDTTATFLAGYTGMQDAFFEALAESCGMTAQELCEAFCAYLCRCRVPERSLLYGDEEWTDGVYIRVASDDANRFMDEYYSDVSQNKTVPVRVAAEILGVYSTVE